MVKGTYKDLPKAFAELNESLNNEVQYMPMVKRVKKYVEDNYQDMQLRLSIFAEQNNVSLSYISKLFKHETGVSFTDYLIRYRIKRSLEFLSDTDYKVCEISERVGYSSQHYYCEAFKKVMGMAPTEYRRKKK
jgi:two-component system response regulator YesN